MDNIFLKELKKNTGTTEQEQNWKYKVKFKRNSFPEPFAFKGFPTNEMIENPVFVSNSELPTIKSIMQSLPSRSNQFILT